MLHAPIDDLAHEPPPASLWQPLRDLALCTLVVCAIALIVGFLTATSAHAQGALASKGELRIGHRIADTFFDRKLIPNAIEVGEAVLPASP